MENRWAGICGAWPSGWSRGQGLHLSVCLCFQVPLRLFPDWASAGGGEGPGGLFAFGSIWGLCLSEVNPTPPLHARSPGETSSPGLPVRVPWVEGRGTGGKQFTTLKPQWNFKGGGLPWPESPLPQEKRCEGHIHGGGAGGRRQNYLFFAQSFHCRRRYKGDTISTAHLLLTTRV